MQFNPGDIVRLKDQTKFGGAWKGNMVVHKPHPSSTLIRAFHPVMDYGGFVPCNLELVPQTTASRIADTQALIAEKESVIKEASASLVSARALLKELTDIPPAVGDVYRHKKGEKPYTIELIVDDTICISWQEGPKKVLTIHPMSTLKGYWVRVV